MMSAEINRPRVALGYQVSKKCRPVLDLSDNDFVVFFREKRPRLPDRNQTQPPSEGKEKNAPAGNTNRGVQDNGEGSVPLLINRTLRS